MANVFVSYREPGAVTAIRLASELRDAGHQVWLDEWEVGLATSIIGRVNEGLPGGTNYLVLCISRDGMEEPWISPEWMSTLVRQLGEHGVRILPVLIERGGPPKILANLPYADLATNWTSGLASLERALR